MKPTLSILCRIALAAGATLAAGSAKAQDLSCHGVSAQYEEALTRIAMTDARRALIETLRPPVASPEVLRRLDNEIAALSTIDGISLDDVAQRYRECRFELFSFTSLSERPPTQVASNCPACEVVLGSLNDVLETLHGVAQQPDSTGVLRTMLRERDGQIGQLLACEHAICRDPWLKKAMVPLAAEDYVAAARAAADPAAWASETIIVSVLPDYAVPHTPVGVYPVESPQ